VSIQYKPAPASLADEYISLRGQTRENPISRASLANLGITAQTWGEDINSGATVGILAESEGKLIGYCFGSTTTGEILVLAVLPSFENRGIGRQLLEAAAQKLKSCGHTRLVLGCSPDPAVRSHGFYRRLGWRSTGEVDTNGDEVLEYLCS